MAKDNKPKAKKGPSIVQYWLNQIASYDRQFASWDRRCGEIIRRYKNDGKNKQDAMARFDILWSNVQTLIPATFSRLPQPDVSRRFGDTDPVARVASLLIERGLDYEIQNYPDYRATMSQCVLDRFLPGRATAWVRYEPHIRAVQMDMPEEGLQVTEDVDEPEEELDYECAPLDYVNYKDFGHSIARTWEEVTAVWRRVYLTREQCIDRWGEKQGAKIPLDSYPDDIKKQDVEQDETSARAMVYEIWDKEKNQITWLSKSMGEVIEQRDDDNGFENFFPCPKPLYATLTNDSLIPTPDFILYQDQARQLDVLAARIEELINALKVRGVYNAEFQELSRLFTEGENNALIPVKNWVAFAEKQGLKGAIEIVDIKPIADALLVAYQAMEQVKQQIYDITGIADIIRGQSVASETATAQQIKGQYASLRLNSMKQQVALFATELLQLKAQVICKKFDDKTILQISAADQLTPEDQQVVPQALEMLRNEPLRSFRIEIAADSLVEMDEQQEKQDRMEMLAQVGGYLEKALPVVQQAPETAPMVVEMLKFGITAFKVGKSIEGVIDKTLDQIKQQIAQKAQQPPPPSPEMMKIQADQQAKAQELQATQQMEQLRLQAEQQREQQRLQFEAQLEQQRQATDMRIAQMQAAFDQQFQRWKAELEAATKIEVAEIGAQAKVNDAATNAAEQEVASQLR